MKALTTYWEMMRGMDFFMQKFLETRAYEKHPGDAYAAHEKGRMAIIESISAGKPLEGLAKAVAMLDDVEADKKQRKFKIGITGDYYTRVCDFANNETFREIEKMGGVVMLPSTLCEFVKYDVHQKPVWAIGHRIQPNSSNSSSPKKWPTQKKAGLERYSATASTTTSRWNMKGR